MQALRLAITGQGGGPDLMQIISVLGAIEVSERIKTALDTLKDQIKQWPMPRKKKEEKKLKVNPQLEGFDITVDSFGELKTTYNIDSINEFLNKNVDDKKLRDRDDI